MRNLGVEKEIGMTWFARILIDEWTGFSNHIVHAKSIERLETDHFMDGGSQMELGTYVHDLMASGTFPHFLILYVLNYSFESILVKLFTSTVLYKNRMNVKQNYDNPKNLNKLKIISVPHSIPWKLLETKAHNHKQEPSNGCKCMRNQARAELG